MANQYFKIDILSFNNHYNNNGPFSIIKNENKSTKTSCQKKKKKRNLCILKYFLWTGSQKWGYSNKKEVYSYN